MKQAPKPKDAPRPEALCWLVWSNYGGPILGLLYMLVFVFLVKAGYGLVTSEGGEVLLIMSLGIMLVASLACWGLAKSYISFGEEFTAIPPLRWKRLAKLNWRYHGLTAFIVLVATPVVAGLNMPPIQHTVNAPGWLMALCLMLLHWLLTLLAFYELMDLENRRIRKVLRVVLFPLRLLRMGLLQVTFLFIYLQARTPSQGGWMERLVAGLDGILQDLLQMDVIGPVVVFLLNPFYVLLDLNISAGESVINAALAFVGATSMLLVMVGLRTYELLSQDWDERFRSYLDDKQTYNMFAALVDENDSFFNELEFDTSEIYKPPPHGPDRVGPEDFQLPDGVIAEEFIADSIVPRRPLIHKPEAIALGLLGLVALYFGKPLVLMVMGLWVLITIPYEFPATRFTQVTPQRIWPIMWLMFKRRVLVYVPVDFAIGVVLAVLFPQRVLLILVMVYYVFMFRLVVLELKPVLKMQSVLAFPVFALGLIILFITVGIGVAMVEDGPQQELISGCLMIVAVSTVVFGISTVLLWLRLRFNYNNLVHLSPKSS